MKDEGYSFLFQEITFFFLLGIQIRQGLQDLIIDEGEGIVKYMKEKKSKAQ